LTKPKQPKLFIFSCTGVLAPLLLLFVSYSSGFSEVVVYKFNNKSSKGVKIEDGQKNSWFWPKDGSDKIDFYVFLEPGDDDQIKESRAVNRNGIDVCPGTLLVNHTKMQKKIGGKDPHETPKIGFSLWGRYRDPGNKRYLAVLTASRGAGAGPLDSHIDLWQGTCSLLDVGGGFTEYYPLKLVWNIWRMDGTFDGSVGTHRDGRCFKTATTPVALDLVTTRAVNNLGLDRAGAVIFACDTLYPTYQEVAP